MKTNWKSRTKAILKRIPFIASVGKQINRRFFSKVFPGSQKYWIQRYDRGGNSGAGSYGKLAELKTSIINEFVRRNNVASVIEYGCGDGNQLKSAKYPSYLGFDISPHALSLCKYLFANDRSKKFKLMEVYRGERGDLTLSLDVIYHLIEDEVFESYMRRLFDSSDRFVIIYSSNGEEQNEPTVPHVKHRKFTNWIDENAHAWRLIQYIPNKYPYSADANAGSSADFYMYEKS